MLPPEWLQAALDPPRALGEPLGVGRIRVRPEDFLVDEILGFQPSGAGPHVLLRVKKWGANTEWVARELAKRARCRPFDVGFAGLKDRHAVTTQHFTVPRGREAPESWLDAAGEGYQVLEATAHHRKLPRGALAGNRFDLWVRDLRGANGGAVAGAALAARIAALKLHGIPNYFGPQRFGRDGSNLRSIAAGELTSDRSGRGFVLSAARSLIFNAVLGARVGDGSWGQLLPGDAANLNGTGSVFRVAEIDATLRARAAALDLHPTGPLCGAPVANESAAGDGARDAALVSGAPAQLEARIAAQFPAALQMIERAAMKSERRALRLVAADLSGALPTPDTLRLCFSLPAGSFATTVLRELVSVDSALE